MSNPQQVEVRLDSRQFACDGVEIHELRGEEHISRLFELTLDLTCADGNPLDVNEVAGADISLVFSRNGEEFRRHHGMVTQVIKNLVSAEGLPSYRLRMGPRHWRLGLVETLDFHLNASIPEIIERKLSMLEFFGGEDFQLRLSGSYRKREFVVQYRETEIAFISRICEQAGIRFFFEHHEGRDTMVFGDDDSYQPIQGSGSLPLRSRGERMGVFDLQLVRNLIPSVYLCSDYNEQQPALSLFESHEVEGELAFGGGIVEYGGHFLSKAEGQQLAKIRAQERIATQTEYLGRSDDPNLSPGAIFSLEGEHEVVGGLLVVSVEHHCRQTTAAQGLGDEGGYTNRFRAIPAARTYRPPRITPVPRVHGAVTGIIETGQGMLEKYAKLDDQGRYLVRFLFDTAPPGEREASCRVRMLQPSAGEGYGSHFPLRPGTEVAVIFLDGNPDRPVIAGAVHNPITPIPVTNSEHTKSRIRSRSGILIEIEDANRGPR